MVKAMLVRGFALCFLLCGLSSLASAQVVKGSISGNVLDSTGAVVPGAAVKATSTTTGETESAVTDQAGRFHLALLGVGTYSVEISKTGFRTLTLNGVAVQTSEDSNLGSVTLEVGQATTTVEVTAAPPLLESTQAQITNTVSNAQITTFPGLSLAQGLDFLALQVPGVVNNRDLGFSNTNGPGFAVNGLRGRDNDQQIDGQNNNDNSVGGPYLFADNPDWVAEYQIVTNNFGPEYGRNAGSVVNVITKSGTNDFHGAFFLTEGNNKLNTLSNTEKAFEGLTKLPVLNNEFSGVSVGGPIKKDRAFFFGGFDDQIIESASVDSTGNLTPTPAGLATLEGCFPGSNSIAALVAFGPYGITGGNPTPSGTPVNEMLTEANGMTCTAQFAGVQRTLSTPTHEYDYTGRLDVNGTNDRVYGRWLYQKITPLDGDPFGTAAAGYPANVPSFGEDFGVSWAHTFSSTMVNEARLSYGRLNVEFGGNGIGNTVPNQGSLANALTNVRLSSPFLSFGPATNAPQGRIVNTYQFQDNWSYVHGRNTLKAGTNLTYQRSPNVFLPDFNGRFSFTNFQNFVSNTPGSVSIALGSPNLDFREHDSFLYVGDDLKARPNLTLNLGLTYTYFGQPANLFHDRTVARESGSMPFFNPALPLSVRTFPALPSPKNQFGPSAGFAYTPNWGGRLTGNGKTVLRGGYRLAYDPPFYNIYLNIASAAPQVLLQTLTGTTAAANPLLAAPLGPAVRGQLAPFLTLGVSDPRSFNQTNVSPNFRGDHVQSWTFGIQRELSTSTVFEARYVGNHGGDLFQSINGNPLIAGIAAAFPNALPSSLTPCPAAQAIVPQAIGRVSCTEGVLRSRTNTAVSDYEGLQTELRASNLAHQLTLRTAYTWSKTTDNASEIFGTGAGGGTLAFSQNPLNFLGAEHGISGLNIPQNWTVSFVEAIPAFRDQQGIRGHVLGGWSLAGTYAIASGQPYTPSQIFLNTFSGPNEYFDVPFDNAFVGTFETARPFAGSPTAPLSAVGIYAGDACGALGVGCTAPANQLISLNAANASASVVNVTPNQVRFIANGQEADTIFGTPFGNVGRNTVRDYQTNIGNFSVYKDIRVTERVKVQFRTDFLNVFNHPNFFSIDPFLEDAGLTSEGTGFGIPSLFSGNTFFSSTGQRQINFGLRITF